MESPSIYVLCATQGWPFVFDLSWRASLYMIHLWVLQCMYYGQTRRIGDNSADGDWFCIKEGVRQGSVLRPRLFSCVLDVALRRKIGNAGMDFQDGMHSI